MGSARAASTPRPRPGSGVMVKSAGGAGEAGRERDEGQAQSAGLGGSDRAGESAASRVRARRTRDMSMRRSGLCRGSRVPASAGQRSNGRKVSVSWLAVRWLASCLSGSQEATVRFWYRTYPVRLRYHRAGLRDGKAGFGPSCDANHSPATSFSFISVVHKSLRVHSKSICCRAPFVHSGFAPQLVPRQQQFHSPDPTPVCSPSCSTSAHRRWACFPYAFSQPWPPRPQVPCLRRQRTHLTACEARSSWSVHVLLSRVNLGLSRVNLGRRAGTRPR